MTPRQKFAAAVRPFGPDGKIPAAAIDEFDALADALGIPRDGASAAGTAHRLGKLSERFESGGRGPGTVSTGYGDPGGVSYGLYQLASKTGTLADFLQHEGARWRAELHRGGPAGSRGFSAAWQAIAKREPEPFTAAQHDYIERTHYRPVVARVKAQTGLDLDARHAAVRDATWSVAVQHGGAARILADAIVAAGAGAADWGRPGYDEKLLRAIYARRSDYVRGVAGRHRGTTRASLLSIVENRYPAELRAALAMLGASA